MNEDLKAILFILVIMLAYVCALVFIAKLAKLLGVI